MDTTTEQPLTDPQPIPEAPVVLVTGAGTGIGLATARRFADTGATVVAVGRRAAPLHAAAQDRPRIRPYPTDLTAPGAPEALVSAVLDDLGAIDVVINNAGIVGGGELGRISTDGAHALFATNLFAPALLVQAALPALVRSRHPVVINVSTSVGQRGWPGTSLYAASKSALELLTRSWAVELAPRGIRVNAVAPGAVDTPIGEHQGLSSEQQDEIRAWQVAHTPLGRIGRPEEVAWVISQLADPRMSFVTGAVIPVDGGAVVA